MGVAQRRTLVAALVLLCVTAGTVAAAATVPVDRALVVRDADTGERLLTEPVDDGTPVVIEYTHSVEKTPVVDAYEVRGTELDNVRMEFSSYGAGLPANQEVTRENGSFVFDPDRSYERLVVNPGPVAGHELVVDGERHDLVALSSDSAVVFTVERRTTVGIVADYLNL
ncbi:DUF1850 domain-containing protein [Halostella sp. JP-L12]|uniref:DUF1850 domain-containing protein n=1 Tax=Halostella TaxID=1843185 RepID=UPI000EF75958|nr:MULTISPECIES: DUF1850 domain-containing protein [Halostella]NHN46334.1 DUF1850 domain-containing protein [Halostella sp. JP-L12]